MSNNTTLCFNTNVFNPELDKTHVARNPMFHTSCTLEPTDFTDNYIKSLSQVIKTLKTGFETTETSIQVNKIQWLTSAAQLMATIHKGVYYTFPLLSTDKYKVAFGLDDSNAAYDFSFTVGSLHYFLTNTTVNHPNNFKQCTHCLKVSSTTTTAKCFEVHLMACNGNADATRLTVINATIRDTCNEALQWKDI